MHKGFNSLPHNTARCVAPGRPVAWIIERKGFRPVMCHHEKDARHAAKQDDSRVTPYFSEWD